MKTLLIFTSLFLFNLAFSQNLTDFNEERLKNDQHLMIGLGSWATANFIGSGIGWATAPNEEMKSFHQMNVLWNTVNLGLAIPGYIRAKNESSDLSFAETLHQQQRTEKIFLINSGLDIGYISAGLLLRSEAKTNFEKRDQFNGFGNGLILQGGFLLVFDLTAYFIHNRHRKNKLTPFFDNIQLSNSGIGIKWNITSSQKTRSFI